jgi:hypothetical protein
MSYLANAQSISANGSSTVLKTGHLHELPILLNVTAVPTGGAPTLDVYIQHSCDEGTNWQDIGHTQFTTSALKRAFLISGYLTGGTAPVASSDAQLAGETVTQGPFGDQVRIRWEFVQGGSSGGYTMTAALVAGGGQAAVASAAVGKSRLMLEDGVFFVLQEDGVSRIVLEP